MNTVVWSSVALLLVTSAGHAATVCVRKNGRLVQRATCRSGERPFDPAALGATGPAGPAGPTGAAGSSGHLPVHVVDTGERVVGTIEHLHPNGALVVLRQAPLPAPTLFQLDASGFVPNTGGALSSVEYLASSCAGVPYLRTAGDELRIAQVYGTAAYVPTGPTIDGLTVRSLETHPTPSGCGSGATPTDRGSCCYETTQQRALAPAVRIPLATLGFVPPFRVARREGGL